MKGEDLKTSAIVLAGGRSLRLGFDKVLERVGSKTLLEQVVSCVAPLSSEVVIVTTEEQVIPHLKDYPNLRVVTDIYPGKGPLGGIYTGLKVSSSFTNLVVAADMPFLNQALLRYMTALANSSDLVMPRVGDMVEPLHAVYTQGCLVPIERMLDEGKLSVHKLITRVNVRYIEADEIRRFDPAQLSFFNINTESDLKMANELSRRSMKDDQR